MDDSKMPRIRRKEDLPDAGYTVWWDDEDGKEIRVDLTEPGALYDYLVEYAAPEGVQEDEL